MDTLFDCPIDDVTYERVDTFLSAAHRESARIQYKDSPNGQIPESTFETVTAMCNGLGGLIFVGVEESREEKNYPKPGGWPHLVRYVGRADQEDIAWSKISDLLDPRPRVQMRFVAPSDSAGHGVLFIRVDAGPQPPYWHAKKGILMRMGDQDRIADLATIRHLFEHGADGDYALEQGLERGWFPAMPDSDMKAVTWLRLLVGPQLPVSHPPMSRALDRAATHLFAGGRIAVWFNEPVHGVGEDAVVFAKAGSRGNHAYEVHAYSDGVTIWSLPVYGVDPAPWVALPEELQRAPDSTADESGGFVLRVEELTRLLYKSAALGLDWLNTALPGYSGPIAGQAQFVNLQYKLLERTLVSRRREELISVPAWTGSFTLASRDECLSALKELFYRFLRSIQHPELQEEGDKLLEVSEREWRDWPKERTLGPGAF